MEKLTNLDHLRQSAARSKELIGEVAQTAAEAIGELAGEVQERIPVKEVTQAEYDALTDEEKQAATVYVLLDEETGGGEGETDTGVASFNGRTGVVTPKAGDYTAKDVGAVPAEEVSCIQALTQAEYDALAVKDAATLYLIKE